MNSFLQGTGHLSRPKVHGKNNGGGDGDAGEEGGDVKRNKDRVSRRLGVDDSLNKFK